MAFSQRISKLENDLTTLIQLEEQLNTKDLCEYHRSVIEERVKGRQEPFCETVSTSVKSCPDCEHHEHVHLIHRHKKKPARTCSCSKELKRPSSSPTPSCYCTSKNNYSFGIEPVITQHIDSIEHSIRKGKEAIDHVSKRSSSRLSTRTSSSKYINRASSCPVRKFSCSSSKSIESTRKYSSSHGCNCDEVGQLKAEVCKIKRQIEEMNSCKREALEVTNVLKCKYNKLAKQKDDLSKQLEELKQENQTLQHELKQQVKLQKTYADEAKDAKNMMNIYKEQASAFQSQSMKNSRVVCETKDKFCKCLEAKDNHINELKQKNAQYKKELEEKDCLCQELKEKCQLLDSAVCENCNKLEQLTESNEKLCKCIRNLEEQLNDAKKDSISARNEIECSKKHAESLKKELADKCACEEKMKKEQKALTKKLEDCSCIERELNDRINQLNKKIADLEKESTSIMVCGDTCRKLREENQRLTAQYEDLVRRVKQHEENDQKSCQLMKRQLDECTKAMNEKEKAIIKERDELRRLVEELTSVVKQNKCTLLHLSSVNKQQELMLKSQAEALASKDNQLQYAEQETDNMKRRSAELEQQVACLREAVDKFENVNCTFQRVKCPVKEQSVDCLMKELENMRMALQAEKENNSVKQKIIDDQTKTLCCLKCKLKDKLKEIELLQEDLKVNSEEVRKLRQELRRLQHELEVQMREKDTLLMDLQHIEDQKNNLENKVNELEDIVNCYCETQENNARQDHYLFAMEQAIQVERREFELQKQILTKERDKAVHAARFATEKLLETVADFQKQVETHKHVQRTLTDLLHEKEAKLKAVTGKISKYMCQIKSHYDEINMKNVCDPCKPPPRDANLCDPACRPPPPPRDANTCDPNCRPLIPPRETNVRDPACRPPSPSRDINVCDVSAYRQRLRETSNKNYCNTPRRLQESYKDNCDCI